MYPPFYQTHLCASGTFGTITKSVERQRLFNNHSFHQGKNCEMMKIAHSKHLLVLVLCVCLSIIQSEREKELIGCQQRSTSGRFYVGKANTTIDGIPCQRWSDTKPHEHDFTYLGDHNFCRNPVGSSQIQVWCYTSALCC